MKLIPRQGGEARMDDRLRRIGEKIETAEKSLNPVLTETAVSAFERRHCIALPEGLRSFLLTIGNGGDGPPHYNLVALGQGPESANQDEVRYWEQLPNVHLDFPFTEPYVWEGGEESAEGTTEQATHGCIFLGTDGCGMDWVLIVTGQERGNVWMVCGEGVVPTSPKRDFLTWYEDWLDGRSDWFA